VAVRVIDDHAELADTVAVGLRYHQVAVEIGDDGRPASSAPALVKPSRVSIQTRL